MLSNPVLLPGDVREAAARQQFLVPKTARCESFGVRGCDHGSLHCLACTQPLLQANDRFALAAIAGGAPAQRQAFRTYFIEVLRGLRLAMPDARLTEHQHFMMLLVPWSYRGELRAVLAQAAASWGVSAPAPAGCALLSQAVDESLSVLPVSEEPGFISSLPSEGFGAVDHRRFKEQLLAFGMAYDGPVQAAVRRLVSAELRRTWHFPLGCTVLEVHARREVTWTLQFEELEMLERAHVLMNPVLQEMARRGSRLRPGDADLEDLRDDVETLVPSLCVTTEGNTQQARVEMARLVKGSGCTPTSPKRSSPEVS